MKPLLVKRTKSNIFRIEHVVFYPGITEITKEEDIEMVQKHKTYQSLIKNGVMQEIKAKPSDKAISSDSDEELTTSNISEMNASNAIDIIRETFSIPILEGMYQRESGDRNRKTVISAIEDQISEIKTPPKKENEE